MDAAEDDGEDRALQGLQEEGVEGGHPRVLGQVLDQLAVVEAEEDESADREDDQQEEEVDHEDVGQPVAEAPAEEVLALREEIEGELLGVALVDHEEDGAVEGVLPEVPADAVVEEGPEEQRQAEEDEDAAGQLVEEELQVVGEEADPVWVLLEEIRVGIVELVVSCLGQTTIYFIDRAADAGLVLAALDNVLEKTSSFESHCVNA